MLKNVHPLFIKKAEKHIVIYKLQRLHRTLIRKTRKQVFSLNVVASVMFIFLRRHERDLYDIPEDLSWGRKEKGFTFLFWEK